MKSNRIRMYCLLLAALLLEIGAFLSVTRTQARYQSVVSWNTVIRYEPGSLRSDCLSDREQIILLGEMDDDSCVITFSLEAIRDANAVLSWSHEAQAFLNVEMAQVQEETDVPLVSGGVLTLEQETTATVRMTLTLTEAFRSRQTVDIAVTCGDLQGTFRVILPSGGSGEIRPTEITEATKPTTAPTETTAPTTAPTEPAATEPTTVPVEIEITSPTTAPTEPPTEATEPTTVPISIEITTATEAPATEPSVTEAAAFQMVEDEATLNLNTAPVVMLKAPAASQKAPVVHTSPVPEESAMTPITANLSTNMLTVNTLQSFDPAVNLPLSLDNPDGAETVFVGLIEETDASKLRGFPALTGYTWKDVRYLLYFGGVIQLEGADKTENVLLLDLSDMAHSGQMVRLGAQTRQGDSVVRSSAVSTRAGVDASQIEMPHFLTTRLDAGQRTGGIAGVGSFAVDLPAAWMGEEYRVDYDVEIFVADENGGSYQQVDLNAGILAAMYKKTDKNHSITVAMAQEYPAAGTYRLNLRFYYKNTCFHEAKTIFQIYYTAGLS